MKTYEEFAAAVDKRPAGVSPLMWLVGVKDCPAEASSWMLRWLREKRADA